MWGEIRLSAEYTNCCCAICGGEVSSASAYLLTAQVNPHRIAIPRWNRTLAGREGARTTCSPEHALEMVAHWMVTGRLDLSFTQDTSKIAAHSRQPSLAAESHTEPCNPIGELVINRDSVRRLVASDPEALASVLDSLLEALERDRNLPPGRKPVHSATATRKATVA
jgi:hypothetical protein